LESTLERLSEANHGVLFPFPDWEEAILGPLDLGAGLRNPYLYAILYDVIYHELTRPSLAIQYALNIFILCANQNSGTSEAAEIRVVVGNSIETLAASISDNFHDFIRTPVYYALGVPLTIVQLIERHGDIGARALIHSNIGWSRSPGSRPDIASMKRSIIADFESQRLCFEESILSFGESTDYCAICHSRDPVSPFVYPAICFTAGLPIFVDSGRIKFSTRQAFCCTHRVHASCFDKSSGVCPVCGCRRNSAIPAFSEDLREFDSPEVLTITIQLAEAIFSSRRFGVGAIDVLADHITMLDARSATRPEVLGSEDVKVLYRNLFLSAALLAYHDRLDFFWSQATPLRRVIEACLKSTVGKRGQFDIESSLDVSSQTSSLRFYRQLALFKHFMLNMPIGSEIVDWDAALEPAALAALFSCPSAPVGDLNRLKPIKLPEEWVQLLLPPYNLDIEDVQISTGICLLTGQKVWAGQQARDGYVTVADHLYNYWCRGAFPMAVLTGRNSTAVVIVTSDVNRFIETRPVWVDGMGMPDYGLRQGRLLSLNRGALAEVLDDLASGKFFNK
jgi:hypothetical protein